MIILKPQKYFIYINLMYFYFHFDETNLITI